MCRDSAGARRYEIPFLQATMYYNVPLSVLAAVLCNASNRFLAFSLHNLLLLVFFSSCPLFKKATITAGKKNRLPAEKQLPQAPSTTPT